MRPRPPSWAPDIIPEPGFAAMQQAARRLYKPADLTEPLGINVPRHDVLVEVDLRELAEAAELLPDDLAGAALLSACDLRVWVNGKPARYMRHHTTDTVRFNQRDTLHLETPHAMYPVLVRALPFHQQRHQP